jgi:hypothetical protein
MSQEIFVRVPSGQIVFREGDDGAEMYIIESGAIDILRAARGRAPLATLGPGDFFGEMAILEDQPRFATAIARAPTTLLRIDRAAFPSVIAGNVEVAIRIMRKLAGRLRRAESGGGDTTVPHPVEVRRAATEFTPLPKTPPARAVADAIATTAAIAPRLVHLSTQTCFRLSDGVEFLVGRPDPVTGTTPEVNLGPLDAHRSLSRRHAKLRKEGASWMVREEVGTLNGTFHNGRRLTPGVSTQFAVGDTLRFGGIELAVRADS